MKNYGLYVLYILVLIILGGGLAYAGGADGPGVQTASARVAEAQLIAVESVGGGQYKWVYNVHYFGLGGTCNLDEIRNVAVFTYSAINLPTAAVRCSAYDDYLDSEIACAGNSLGVLLSCDIIVTVPTSP